MYRFAGIDGAEITNVTGTNLPLPLEASIIIPMYNAVRTILETLHGLEEQFRNDFEVIVVDDGSTDDGPRLVSRYALMSTLKVRLLCQPRSGPAAARNLGAQHARGRVIIFLDADCIPPNNWLSTMTEALSNGVVGCNCGYRVRNEGSWVARYVDYEIGWRHGKLIGRKINTIGSYSAAFERQAFLEVRGFDTRYSAANAEDFDLGFRITSQGHRLAFTSDTFVYHYHPSTLRRYLRQQFLRGYWRVKMYLMNKDRILGGDSYTGREAQAQFLLVCLLALSLPTLVFTPTLFLAALTGLTLSNLPLAFWAWRRERKFIIIAPLLASLRSCAGTIGACAYLLHSITRWVRGL